MSHTWGFLGCGNLAQALILGALDKNLLNPSEILIANRTLEKSKDFSKETDVIIARSNAELIDLSRVVVIGIKPLEIIDALEEMAHFNLNDKIIISLAAGVPERVLKTYCSHARTVVRVMANTSAMVQKGVFGIYFIKGTLDDKKLVTDFFGVLGEVVLLKSDKQIDVVTAGAASGTGFVISFIEEFDNWFKKKGISSESSRKMAIETFLGAASLAKVKSETSLKEIRMAITSKKGTTLAGLQAFKKAKLATGLRSGLNAAFNRSRQIAKSLIPKRK